MPAVKVATYVAVFAAGALALAGFTAFTDSPEPSAAPSSPAASTTQSTEQGSEQGSGSVAEPTGPASGDAESLTAIGDISRNTMVTVRGTVQAINDEDEFTLVDDTGSVRVWTAGTFFTVDPGEQVTVEGFVDDDVVVEIYAQQITRADGSVVDIDRSSSY